MSGIGTGTGLLLGGLIGGAGALGGAALQSSAAGDAASTQANAADRAAALQYQASQNALQFQEQQFNQQQQNLAPWLQSGGAALSSLDYLMGVPMQSTGNFVPEAPGSVLPNGQAAPGTYDFSNGGTVGAAPAGPTAGFSALNGTGGSSLSLRNPKISAMPELAGSSPIAPAGPSGESGVRMVNPNTGVGGGFGNIPVVGGPKLGAGGGMPGAPGGAPASGAAPSGGSFPGFGSLLQTNPYSTFTAPTGLTEQNDPGYQARLALGTDALQRSAAARGGLLTGATGKALDTYAQDYASNEYSNVYNRAFNTNAANYNAFNQNQNNVYNRLASLAGVGQQSAEQLGYLGNQASGQISNNLLGTASAMGQQYNNAAAANASGMVGSANAWGNALGGLGSNLSNLYMLSQMGNGGGNYLGMQGALLGQSIWG